MSQSTRGGQLRDILLDGSRRLNGPSVERRLTFDYGTPARRATPESVRHLERVRDDIERNRHRRLMVVVP